MSVNWNWKHKLGEVFIKQGENTFKVNMYGANCLCALIYDFKEKDQETGKMVDKYTFYSWFSDIKHLKNCLGLTKKYPDNILDEFKKVRINTYYYEQGRKDLLTMATLFAKVGIKVELYYKAPKENKSHSTKKGE